MILDPRCEIFDHRSSSSGMYVELNLSESLGFAAMDGQVRKLNLAAGKLTSVVCFAHYYLPSYLRGT